MCPNRPCLPAFLEAGFSTINTHHAPKFRVIRREYKTKKLLKVKHVYFGRHLEKNGLKSIISHMRCAGKQWRRTPAK